MLRLEQNNKKMKTFHDSKIHRKNKQKQRGSWLDIEVKYYHWRHFKLNHITGANN